MPDASPTIATTSQRETADSASDHNAQRPEQDSKRRIAIQLAPALLPWLVLVTTQFIGLDYGFHWDEANKQIRNVKHMVRSETLMPNDYLYGGVIYWVGLAAITPEFVEMVFEPPSQGRIAATLEHLDTEIYTLRFRSLMIVLSSLGIFWVYGLVWIWRHSWPEALLAASILGLSWELAYHGRYIGPDVLMMQFGALTIMLAVAALLRSSNRLLFAAAIAAGVATGTKYPGGMLLLPLAGIAFLMLPRPFSLMKYARRLMAIGATFTIAYLITTPGTILAPTKFIHSLHYVITLYGREGFYKFTVDGPLDHAQKLFTYFSQVFFSPFMQISVLLSASVFVGAWSILREDYRRGAVFCMFPVLFFLYFTNQRAMLVRNLFVTAPFLAVLAARGIFTIDGWISGLKQDPTSGRGTARRYSAYTFRAAVVVALLCNAGWLVYAADTIAHRNGSGVLRRPGLYPYDPATGPDEFVARAAEFLAAQPEGKVAVSRKVRELLLDGGHWDSNDNHTNPAEPELIMATHREPMHRRQWPTHLPRLFYRQFGPLSVNLNVYPTWMGDDEIVLIKRDVAEEVGVPEKIWRN